MYTSLGMWWFVEHSNSVQHCYVTYQGHVSDVKLAVCPVFVVLGFHVFMSRDENVTRDLAT